MKLIVETCTANLQTIDLDTQDTHVRAEWDADARERSQAFVSEFEIQLIRDHIKPSPRFERDDLDFAPFDAQGGLGKMHQLFGDSMDELIEEINGELVA